MKFKPNHTISEKPYSRAMFPNHWCPSGRTFTLLSLTCLVLSLPMVVSLEKVALAKEEAPLRELPRPKFRLTPPHFQEWTFDQDSPQSSPRGFTHLTIGNTSKGQWRVIEDDKAISRANVVTQTASCPGDPCFHILIADGIDLNYVDFSVGLRTQSESESGRAGLVFGAKDRQTFYAVTIGANADTLEAERIQGTHRVALGKAKVKPKGNGWQFIRIQRTTILSKEVLEIFFNNQLILSLSDSEIDSGTVGVVTTGASSFAFDNLRAVELLTSRPLSRPPAY